RVNEGDACARSEARAQKSGQRPDDLALQLDEALIADQVREFSPQMLADLLRVVSLEVPEAGELNQDDKGHHFARAQSRFPMAMALAVTQAQSARRRLKNATELVAVKEQS